MQKILIDASKKYHVHVGKGIIESVGKLSKECSLFGKAAVISDTNVSPLYYEKVKKSLTDSGFEVHGFVFESGEKSKNATTYLSIVNFMAENKFSRNDTVFALGGGVVGDISGFCAATYMRGINFVQLPTSLLAMVDSSVGGKTAIDLEIGKNLVGAFYQPKLVVCDVDLLKTLPKYYFNDGMAEVIKYAMIRDDALSTLILGDIAENIEKIIARCIEIKAEIVKEDEFDGGLRKILNFGHTIGHSIEMLSNFTLSHGRGVSIGMHVVTNALEKRGECAPGTTMHLSSMLDKFDLPKTSEFSIEDIYKVALHDKKAEGKTIDIVETVAMGKARYRKIGIDELKNIIKEGIC